MHSDAHVVHQLTTGPWAPRNEADTRGQSSRTAPDSGTMPHITLLEREGRGNLPSGYCFILFITLQNQVPGPGACCLEVLGGARDAVSGAET